MILGLPAHPLIVHLVVVLLPLSVLGLVAALLLPKLRRVLGALAAIGAVVGSVAAYLAREAGETLERQVSVPEAHAQLGDATTITAIIYAVAVVIWWLLNLRYGRKNQTEAAATVNQPHNSALPTAQGSDQAAAAKRTAAPVLAAGGIAAIIGVAVVVLTVLTGHSGAEAVWGHVNKSSAPSEQAKVTPANPQNDQNTQSAKGAGGQAGDLDNQSPETTGENPQNGAATMTLEEIAKHNTAQSCWAAINGKVYDLSAWVQSHPGGPGAIQKLCGTDATAAFEREHAGQADPAEALARFLLGPVQ